MSSTRDLWRTYARELLTVLGDEGDDDDIMLGAEAAAYLTAFPHDPFDVRKLKCRELGTAITRLGLHDHKGPITKLLDDHLKVVLFEMVAPNMLAQA